MSTAVRSAAAIRRAVLSTAACIWLVIAAAPVFASDDVLPLADLGGVRDFRADSDRSIYIQGRNRQWYRADFVVPCVLLRFNDTAGFVIEPYGDLDKFSSIIVGGQQCYFRSFAKVDGPPPNSTKSLGKNRRAKKAVEAND